MTKMMLMNVICLKTGLQNLLLQQQLENLRRKVSLSKIMQFRLTHFLCFISQAPFVILVIVIKPIISRQQLCSRVNRVKARYQIIFIKMYIYSYLCLKIVCGTGTLIGRPKQPFVPHGTTTYSQKMNEMMILCVSFSFFIHFTCINIQKIYLLLVQG